MKLTEIDPGKRYVLMVGGDLARQDLENMQARLVSKGLDNVTIIAGGSMADEPRYWGIWCHPPDRQPGWVKGMDGRPHYYPSPAIAQAALDDLNWTGCDVKEFTLHDLEEGSL